MELYPIPPEVKIDSKLSYLVLTIKNNNYWYLFDGLCLFAVIYSRWILLLDSLNKHDERWIYEGLWIISTLYLFFIFWNNKVGIKYGTTELRMDNDILTINKKFWILSNRVRVSRLEIDNFYQLKDDFKKHHWGLKLKTIKGKTIELVSYKPIAVSNWLGTLLADTYRVDFIPSALIVPNAPNS